MLLLLMIYLMYMVDVHCQIDTWTRGSNLVTLNGKYRIEAGITTIVDCSFKCSSKYGCRHFFFDFTSSVCYLHSNFFSSQSFITGGASRYDPSGVGYNCPSTFKLTEDGICFYVMNNQWLKAWYNKAREACQVYGADLMVIDSPRKHDVVLKYVHEDKHYHFGIYNITEEGQFLTVDGRTDANFTYRNWHVNYPDDIEDAIYGVFRTFPDYPLFFWRNSLKKIRYYICQLEILL